MLKQQQGYVLSKIGPHTYLLPYGQSIADQKHGIIINETGEFLWKMLESPQSMDTLITALAGHYQMDSSEISNLSEDVVQSGWDVGTMEFSGTIPLLGIQPNQGNARQYEYHILKITEDELRLCAPEPGAGASGTAWFWNFKKK